MAVWWVAYQSPGKPMATWREVRQAFVRYSGAWKLVKQAWVRDGGSWKKIYGRDFSGSLTGTTHGVCVIHQAGQSCSVEGTLFASAVWGSGLFSYTWSTSGVALVDGGGTQSYLTWSLGPIFQGLTLEGSVTVKIRDEITGRTEVITRTVSGTATL